MAAEKQARVKVARSKWVERRAANRSDVALGQVHQGRGARIGSQIEGWIFESPTICNRYINTKNKHKFFIMALQLPDYDRMSSGSIIVAEEDISDQITHRNAGYIMNLYNMSVSLHLMSK